MPNINPSLIGVNDETHTTGWVLRQCKVWYTTNLSQAGIWWEVQPDGTNWLSFVSTMEFNKDKKNFDPVKEIL